jgi:peroxiredoxin
LIELYKRDHSQGLKVLAISFDSAKALKAYANKMQIPFPVLWDSKNVVRDAYQMGATPSILLIDRGGKIVLRLAGYTALTSFKNQFVPAVEIALKS